MQKYKRLCLFVIASLSLILMFVYRHKYSQLNTLFEMMKAFKVKHAGEINTEILYEIPKTKTNHNIVEQVMGLPLWSEIFPGIYIYSSYWLFGKTRSLFLTKNIAIKQIVDMQCIMNYGNGKSGVNTKANMILLEKRGSQILFFIECICNSPNVPDSIYFVYENMTSIFPLPIIKQIQTSESLTYKPNIVQPFNTNQYTACVAPFPPTINDIYKILEFIIYYHHMGVKFFILYDTGLSSTARHLLLDNAVKNGIYVLLLPWNIPSGTSLNFNHAEAYHLDCFHRVLIRGYSGIVFKLRINDYIVSKRNWNISQLNNASKSNIAPFSFHQKKFCTNYPKDIIAVNLFMPFVTLLNTKMYNEEGSSKQMVYSTSKLKEAFIDSKEFHTWIVNQKSQQGNLISKKYATLHSYENCDINITDGTKLYTEDKIMWKFKDLFFKSNLYTFAKKQHLINDS